MRGVAEIGPDAIEFELVEGDDAAPPLVFLHEGLGSVDLWRGFPGAVRDATGRTTLVYSRAGHGRSSVVAATQRTARYMHDEALVALPNLIVHFGLSRPLLVGHSDGASIAIIYAGAGLGPVAGLALLAPHVFVEDRSIEGIEAARATFLSGDLPRRMARYHDDADATFWGWNRVWLSAEFRDWNIEPSLPAIDCPILVVQGADDAYGTLAQVDAIERGATASPSVQRLVLAGCGHSPHLDRPAETTAAVVGFVESVQA
jgi:pimeloyl-ACP methyl ester carboxylesterase